MSETIHLTVQEQTEALNLNTEQIAVVEAVSPEVTAERVEGGVKITAKDWKQETEAVVLDGAKGGKGDAGDPGHDGVSPTASVTQTATGATVTVTDASGTTTANLTNGQDGEPGQDGYSPTASVSKSGDTATITITDKNGTTAAQVEDGQDGVSPTITVTDITGGHRVTITDATGAHSFDVMDGEGGVTDVQVNGTSVVSDGVASITTDPTVTVSGTTPVITALPGIRYVCGEVSTLDITLQASGCVDVVFTSGSTPTVLTVTPPSGMTMRWAGGFDPTSLEADTTYEINVCDGLGVAGSWT